MSFASEKLFTKILNLGDQWEVYHCAYQEDRGVILLRVRETLQFFENQRCTQDKRHKAHLFDHAPTRFWRHLNVFSA